ncbi:MAG: class I SAM-dependent methyltransferase, partial [Solirubrobacterales bacterium]
MVEAARVEPGSFRDRDSRVVVAPDAVYRALSGIGADDWRALASSPLLERFTSEGTLIGTEEVGSAALGDAAADILPEGTETVLRHERVPFVSYPYEWTFEMLRDAALLQLDLQLAALDEGLTLKDATP